MTRHLCYLVINWVVYQHPLISFVAFSNLVSLMPTPKTKDSLYERIFTLTHLIAANIGRVLAAKFPQVLMFLGQDVRPKEKGKDGDPHDIL